MRKTLSFVLAMLMVLSSLIVVSPLVFAETELAYGQVASGYAPEGTAVANAEQFAAMTADGKYYLTANITLSASYAGTFMGMLDGNGYTVTTTAPVFTAVKNATVKNLTVAGTVDCPTAADATGALVNNAENVTLENVVNTAAVKGARKATETTLMVPNADGSESVAKKFYVFTPTGGLVGFAFGGGSFTKCENKGEINGLPAGGIVGMAGRKIDCDEEDGGVQTPPDADAGEYVFEACLNNGAVTDNGVTTDSANKNATLVNPGSENFGQGGVLGQSYDVKSITFNNCVNNATVEGLHGLKIVTGGIFGTSSHDYMAEIALTWNNCSNTGNITGNGQTGGMLGYGGSAGVTNLNNCVNTGTIASIATTITTNEGEFTWAGSYAGGVLGRPGGKGYTVSNCVNGVKGDPTVANVSSSNGNNGGICGYASDNINGLFDNCINYANVTTVAYGNANAGILGAIADSSSITIKNCVNYGKVNNGTAVGGILGSAPTAKATIENCVNYGDITGMTSATSGTIRVGGIAGYMAGKSQTNSFTALVTFRNCVNNGVLAANNTSTADGTTIVQIRAGGILGYDGKTVGRSEYVTYFYNCVNNGNISDPNKGRAAGIVGETKSACYFEDCANYGDITAGAYAGGIGACMSAEKQTTYYKNTAVRCANYGKITANTNYAGGIFGYVYGTAASYAEFFYCISAGDVTCKSSYSGGLVAYHNTKNTVAKYNLVTGTVTTQGALERANALGWNNKNAFNPSYFVGNVVLEGACANGIATNGATNKALSLEAAAEDGWLQIVSSDALESGEVAAQLNKASGTQSFRQDIGFDSMPTLDKASAPVVEVADGEIRNVINLRGYQLSADMTKGTFNIRFVATIDNLDYKRVGFRISEKNSGKQWQGPAEEAYSQLLAASKNGEKYNVNPISATEDLGANYIVAAAVTGIPTGGVYEFTVTAYMEASDGVEYTSTYNVTIAADGTVTAVAA